MKQHYILRTEQDKQNFSSSFSKFNLKAPIVINIDYFYKKNSNQQLRAYWRLIKVCKAYMNSPQFGNNFDDESISDYFKIKSGHYTTIGDEQEIKIPSSISLNSGTTTKDIKHIIDIILEFGLDNNIEDCYIENQELEELLRYYEKGNE